MDDQRVGRLIRALRRRRNWRQRDLSAAAGVNQSDISEMERGHVARYRVAALRAVLGALDAGCELEPRWRGAAIDRLLDERHAALCGQGGGLLAELGWDVAPEVTFSEYGERGSIDLFAARPAVRAVVVREVKSEFGSLEATLRAIDAKTRLAPKVCRDRFGFEPALVGRFLILPESTTVRRRLAQHAPLLDPLFPLRGWDARRWLADPRVPADGRPVGGVLLLPDIAARDRKRAAGGPERVRRRRSSPDIAARAR